MGRRRRILPNKCPNCGQKPYQMIYSTRTANGQNITTVSCDRCSHPAASMSSPRFDKHSLSQAEIEATKSLRPTVSAIDSERSRRMDDVHNTARVFVGSMDSGVSNLSGLINSKVQEVGDRKFGHGKWRISSHNPSSMEIRIERTN